MKLSDIITPFKVGLVVLAAIMATLYMVTVLTQGEGWSTQEGYTVYATFEDVTGLAKNSRVMMSGISIGTLQDFELQREKGAKVRVVMRIDPEVELYQGERTEEGYWKNGATVTKTQASVIGDYFLEVTPGTAGDKIEDGDAIKNVPQTIGPSQLFSRFDRIASNLEEITDSMSAVFGGPEGERSMRQMLTDLKKMLSTMRGFVDQNSEKIDRILSNAENISTEVRGLTATGTDSLRNIMADAESIVEEVKFIVGESSTDVQAGLGTLRGTLGRLQTTLDSLNYSLQNIQDITDKVNEGEGAVGQLVNDPEVVDTTNRILKDVEGLTDRYDKLKTFVNLRNGYHFRHQQFKTTLGVRLQPGPNKYYLAEFVDDFRGTTTVTQRDVSTTRADTEDGVYRETTVETTDEFKFSFQLARSLPVNDWMKVTGRFGLIESSGGFGGNLLLGNNQSFDLQVDAYEFGLNRNPRVRSMASYDVLQFAYIAGGVDDILNGDRRDYFLGAGIEFNDEDLKALITATGVPSQ